MTITWLEDPLKFTYLREHNYMSCSSRFPVKSMFSRSKGKVIGYEITSHVGKVYHFRFWFLKIHDRDMDPEGIYKYNQPIEVVNPTTIESGKLSITYKTPLNLLQYHLDHIRKLKEVV